MLDACARGGAARRARGRFGERALHRRGERTGIAARNQERVPAVDDEIGGATVATIGVAMDMASRTASGVPSVSDDCTSRCSA